MRRHEKQIIGAKAYAAVWLGAILYIFASGTSQISSPTDGVLRVLIGCILIVTAISDAEYMVIPDEIITAISALAGIRIIIEMITEWITYYSFNTEPFILRMREISIDRFCGFIISMSVYLLIAVISGLISRQVTVGGGDIKLVSSLGLLTGINGIIFVMCASAVISAVSLSIQLIIGAVSKDEVHPYAPYLCIATALCLKCI